MPVEAPPKETGRDGFVPLSEICCEYVLRRKSSSPFEWDTVSGMIASPPYQPSVQCRCVNTVLPDLWPGADAPPCASCNSNLFEQLYMLSHVLLSENDAVPKSLSGMQPTAKNPITDIESYPVRVRCLFGC